jgi:Flp pilus assembly protein TadG
MTMLRRLRQRRDDSGAAAVEFALVMIPLLYIVFGIIQYGWYFYSMQTGTSATAEAVRRVSVGSCQNAATLRNFVVNRLGSASTSSSAVTVDETFQKWDSVNSVYTSDSSPGTVGGKVTMTVTFQTLDMHFPLIPVPNGAQVTRTVSARIEDTVDSGGSCS